MDGIRQYLLQITAAAVICSMITGFTDKKGAGGTLVKLLCGLFMTLTMVSPLIQIRFSDFSDYFSGLQAEADAAVAYGEAESKEAMAAIIKQKMESYILDKAAGMGLELQAVLYVDDSDIPNPYRIELQGRVSPYQKGVLQDVIINELGIPKENQIWR